ncbi:hypothetical protein H1V43_02740 [Streptomyces sp. PSKA54]|uniref:Integral membrane protein n=1 Tax=Streptomyces himalayensis subsp. aureolus TaxID=2758039 RepID=A0A7W2CWP8_9ACTN|nr:hypothetical protein [Streptomyces himalayensis]MBA4860317.1 hypothetical protein [Streptomyces himalayensis subsp. aureolus]
MTQTTLRTRPPRQRTVRSLLRGSSPGHPRRRLQITPYGVVSAAVLAVLLPICVKVPWRADLGQHAATIERLRVDLLHPGSTLIDLPVSSPYYSPYTVAAALAARAADTTALGILPLCALVNTVLLLTGVRAFVRTLSTSPWAPALALPALLVLWGPVLRMWAGNISLLNLALDICFPSIFVVGLTFHIWALTARAVGRSVSHTSPLPRWGYAVLGLLTAVALLSHAITGAGTVLGMVALVAGRLRVLDRRTALRLVLSCSTALGAVLVWPYYNVLRLVGANQLDYFHNALYRGAPYWYGLALIGLPSLLLRLRRDRLDPLVLLFVLAAAGVAYGWCTGHYTWGRLISTALVPLQLALVIDLVEARNRVYRAMLAAVTAVGLTAGAWAQAGVLLHIVPERHLPTAFTQRVERRDAWPGYEWAVRHMHPGDVVMAAAERPIRMLPAYGVYTVAPIWQDPLVPEAERRLRWSATRAFFAPDTTPADRERVLRRYHADWVLVDRADQPTPQGPGYERVASRGSEILLRRIGA